MTSSTEEFDRGDSLMAKRRRPFINRSPRALPPGAPEEAALAEFGRRIQAFMVKKSFNQSDLARAAAKFMPDKKFNRDNISVYVRGKSFPNPVRLNAVAKALGVTTEELMPEHGIASVDEKAPPLDVRSIGDGNVWLRINQATSMEIAMKIMTLLGGQKPNADRG